jgi:hypothetical protein
MGNLSWKNCLVSKALVELMIVECGRKHGCEFASGAFVVLTSPNAAVGMREPLGCPGASVAVPRAD